MGILLGVIAGLGLGVLVVRLVGGVVGIVAGMAAGALAYLGVSQLATPERKLGGVAASLLPNGEAIAAQLDQGQDLVRQLQQARQRTRTPQVAQAMAGLEQAVQRLVTYVQDNPSAARQLGHFLNTYANQCSQVLQSWSLLEGSGDLVNIHEGTDDVLLALQGLTVAATGELEHATGAHVAQIEASQAAIRRLTAMDGYQIDAGEKDEGSASK